jgi:hypothetical protein
VSENTLLKLIMAAAAVEAAMGLTLMLDPSIVSRLILGEELSGVGIALGRVAGFGFVAFALACWPQRQGGTAGARPLQALLTYNVLATIYLVSLGFDGSMVGSLLWPAAALHACLTLLLGRACFHKAAVNFHDKPL